MFPIKIAQDILNLRAEREERHDCLGGASGVWSHEAEFGEKLSESSITLSVIRMVIQLQEQQKRIFGQLEEAFLAMQSVGEISSKVTFVDRFTVMTPQAWINRLGRMDVKTVDLCLLPQTQELRLRTPEEIQTIHIVLKDKQGKKRSLYHQVSPVEGGQTHETAQEIIQFFRSESDVGQPVEHPLFVLEVDLSEPQQTPHQAEGTSLLDAQTGEREAVANQAPVCNIKLSREKIGFFYPHFTANEDQGQKITSDLLQPLRSRLQPLHLEQPRVLDRRYEKGGERQKLHELEVLAGFTFSPEEIAWHNQALKAYDHPQTPGQLEKSKPSFVQLVGMAQGFLTESTTYLCVGADNADLQLALLPYMGSEEIIASILAQLRKNRSSTAASVRGLFDLLLLDTEVIRKDFQEITSFTNQDIADCRAGHGLIAQLYVSTHSTAKALFAQLFGNIHQRLERGPAQISSVFHDGPVLPTVFTTAIDKHAPIGIGVKTEKFVDGSNNRQLTFRLRLEPEVIQDLQAQHQTEGAVTQAALDQVELQTQRLRETMMDLSLILRLAVCTTPKEKTQLYADYLKLLPKIDSENQTI
jgi:hypothetical protein